MGEAKLEARHLTQRFARDGVETTAVEDISFAVGAGEFVSFVGPSGCGKTTILRSVDGLLRPSAGEIRVDGRVVTEPARDRAFVFQQDGLLPWLSVRQNVAFGLEIQGAPAAERDRRARELIALVGLGGFEGHYPLELSGGMRQRVNLARALAVEPQVLLMDEPFASLDAQTREVMQAELLRVWEQRRVTVLFVTHQIDEAAFLSDRVVVMTGRPGRIREELAIDLPRPRALALKRSSAFVAYVDTIWSLIEKEIIQQVQATTA